MPFVKLDCGIIHSSLWAEDSDTKICWITLLLLADATGFVRAAASAIAREAGISAAAGRRALDLFSSPDDESRTPDNQGKRIEKIDGGYRVLNYEKYRERDYTNAERQRRYRQSRNTVTPVTSRVTPVTRNGASRMQKQKHTKDIRANGSPPASFDVEDLIKKFVEDPTYKGIDVRREFGKMSNWCVANGKIPTQRRFVNWLNRTDKPLTGNGSTKPTYKRNYLPPPREPSEQELEEARAIARQETEKLREKLGR